MAIRIHTSAKTTYRELCGGMRQAAKWHLLEDRASMFHDMRDACAGVCPEIYEAAWNTTMKYQRELSGWRNKARYNRFAARRLLILYRNVFR